MNMKRELEFSYAVRLIASFAALTLPLANASAETSPYYFGGGLGVTQVSNVYRESGGGNGDTVGTATLLAGLDQRLGRQRLFGDASVQQNRYRSNSLLNNRSYSAKVGLDWETLERLSGTLNGGKTRALATYNVGSGIAPIFKKNVEDNTELNAVARLGLVTRYSLEAVAGTRSRRYSAIEYARLQLDQNRYSLGVAYQPSADLRLGLAARLTRDKYPRATLTNGDYAAAEFERKDLDLTGRWTVSGASAFEGRLSTGRSSVKLGVGSDFSGLTGLITWSWRPLARWAFSTSVSRDTGLETSFFNVSGTRLNSDLNRITTAVQLSAAYELSSKVALNSSASFSKSDRSRDSFALGEYDRDSAYNLGLRYQYSRGVQFSCQISHQARDSSTPQYVYTANSYGCNGQLIIN